jgi:hypothetical protein
MWKTNEWHSYACIHQAETRMCVATITFSWNYKTEAILKIRLWANHYEAFFFQWFFQPIQGPGLLFSSVIIFTDGSTPWRVISPSQGLYLNTGQHKHRINAYTHQRSMPWERFEPTIPTSEQEKTVHALDRAATVTGSLWSLPQFNIDDTWLPFHNAEIHFSKRSFEYNPCRMGNRSGKASEPIQEFSYPNYSRRSDILWNFIIKTNTTDFLPQRSAKECAVL